MLTREDDTAAILRCLHESLRDTAFAGALALVLATDERDAERRRKQINGNE